MSSRFGIRDFAVFGGQFDHFQLHAPNKKQNKLSLSLIGQKTVKKLLPFIHHLRSVGYRDIKEDDFKIFLNVLDKICSNYQQFEVLPPQYKNADEPRN